MTPTKITVFFYNRLFDPLIMGNFWVFIADIQTRLPDQFQFHFITYENDANPLTNTQRIQLAEMKRLGVDWTPLPWHPGAGARNKMTDIFAGFRAVAWQRAKGSRHVVSYNSVAGSFSYLYARVLGMRLYMYSYEPHSEYSLDNGILSESSLQYRALHALERRAAQFATVISSGTRFMQARLEHDWEVKARFFKIPSVTDERKFAFDGAVRAARRAELGLTDDRKVLLYPGKFGGLYYDVEVAQMFRWLLDADPTLFFLVLTPQPPETVKAMFEEAGVPPESYTVRRADYDDVPAWFWAADFGVIAVPAGPSKRFISNIKVGEYLCAGLPFLITEGVSEDYLFAREYDVGVVVKSFDEPSIRGAWPEMRALFDEDQTALRVRCTRAGRAYRGFETLRPRFEEALRALLGLS
jgi:hypothetical protein